MEPEHDEARARARQARLLRAFAARLEGGDASAPTDVIAPLERELELRLDDEAIDEAWAMQGDQEAEPWAILRGRALV
jgi:hypothetical protein